MSKWFVSPEQRGGGWAIESDTHGVVAVALQRDKHPMHGKEVTWKEAEEHARLIAAAPDLLEALKRCRFDSFNMTLEDLAFCRAAYTKAIGESS